jgi:hypothetical protein
MYGSNPVQLVKHFVESVVGVVAENDFESVCATVFDSDYSNVDDVPIGVEMFEHDAHEPQQKTWIQCYDVARQSNQTQCEDARTLLDAE